LKLNEFCHVQPKSLRGVLKLAVVVRWSPRTRALSTLPSLAKKR